MPRKNDARRKNNPHRKHYGVPTEMVAVRMPADLHKRVKAEARRGRMPKSRKVVELLEKGLAGAAPERTMSEAIAAGESVFE